MARQPLKPKSATEPDLARVEHLLRQILSLLLALSPDHKIKKWEKMNAGHSLDSDS